MMVVVGGGMLKEDTIWASSKGRRGVVKDAKVSLFSGHKRHPRCCCKVLIP